MKHILANRLSFISITVLSILLVFNSCSSSDDSNVQENIEAAEKILQDLPQLKEEVNQQKEQMNSQQLTGSFKGELSGEAFEFSNWMTNESRISFLDFKGLIYATISKKPMEQVTIEFAADKWSEKDFPLDVAASVYVSENGEYLKVNYVKKDANGDVLSEFQSAEGTMTIKEFNDNRVTISFDGEGFVGDFRKQERTPLNFEIDLDYNFITSDARSNK
ncbi:MAG: hypothetical protein P8P74_02525 [Crocinitomicaceae bacterium]|nr:hypothetical protein [Crocinitomicaceae bacterium]